LKCPLFQYTRSKSLLFHRDDDILYVAENENFIPLGSSIRSVPCINSQSPSSVTSGDRSVSLCSKLNSEWVTLNVGGKYFTTSRSTLMTKEPMSMLARLVNHQFLLLLMLLSYLILEGTGKVTYSAYT
jgi:hypothetical protein